MFVQTSSVSSRTPLRDIDFSDVSSKTLLVLIHRRIFRPSHVHLLGGATVFRPHHCQPQWVAKNSLWAAAWATAMLFHVVEQMTGLSAFDFVVPSASITMFFNLYNTVRIFLWLLSSAALAILFGNILIASCHDWLW